MDFQKHTSSELVELFNKKPYQGQSPEKAKIIFLSTDANYSPAITSHSFFKYILEYQEDGVKFWEKYGCHHPFLLKEYPFNRTKDGCKFHSNFRRIGFGSEYAKYFSFLELLDVPTIGNKSDDRALFNSLFSKDHLEYIEKLMLSGGEKLFFVSGGALRDIVNIRKKHSVFKWIDLSPKSKFTKTINGNKIKEIYHFSSSHIHRQVDEIYKDVNDWIGKI